MDKRLKTALLQFQLVWEDPEANRSAFAKIIDSISDEVDLIVLPEMFTTGFSMSPANIPVDEGKKTLAWMQEIAKRKNAAIMGSLPYYEMGQYTNRLFFVKPNGSFEQYDKRHTFTLAGENKVYGSGRQKVLVNFRGFKICPMICYDLRFPVWARNVDHYDVLVYVANWPKARIHAWDILLAARAIENMSYCIGVNRIGTDGVKLQYPGHSAIYDALGKPLVFSQKEDVLYGELSMDHLQNTRGKLKFLDDMDRFNLIL